MATTSAKKFLELLEKSDLIPPAILKQALVDLKEQVGSASVDFEQLSNHLIDQKLITEWQRDKLADGKFKGFFLGKYKLLGHLGTGGMSSVFLAEHNISGRLRAIKVLPRKKVSDASYLDRFYQEGRAAAAVDHPNIVRIYDIIGEEDTHYMVMEYAKGIDLHRLVKASGPVAPELAVKYILQSAIGLQHAHGRNLVHRDIKPANILLGDDGGVKILDLGLALLKSDDESSLTVQHNERVMGTADYLAPEQAVNSHRVDHRADIYSLGCTFYYLLTGHPPFPDGTLAERILAHQKKEPASILESAPHCPQPLVDIIRKMMQKKRSLRFQDCGDLMRALDLYRVGETDCVPEPVSDLVGVIELSSSSINIDVAEVADVELKTTGGFKIPEEMQQPAVSENELESDSSEIDAQVPKPETPVPEPPQRFKTKKKKKQSPFAKWSLVAALALLVSGLGYLLYLRDTDSSSPNTLASMKLDKQTPSSLPLTKSNTTSGSTYSAKKPAVNRSNAKFPIAVSKPNSLPNRKQTKAIIRVDANEITNGKINSLPLREGNQSIGSLRCGSGCELLSGIGNSSGRILLHGGSKAVEFRPNSSTSRLNEIRMLAKRQSNDGSLNFEIQVKSALKKDSTQRWQTVYSFDNDINTLNASTFTEIRISDLELGILEPVPQKFRFFLGGEKNSGVVIDELSVKVSQ